MKHNLWKNFAACFMTAAVLIGALSSVSLAFPNAVNEGYTIKQMQDVTLNKEAVNQKELTEPETAEQFADDEIVTYIVELNSKAVLETYGTLNEGKGGGANTAQSASDNIRSLTAKGKALREEALRQQEQIVSQIENLGVDVNVKYNFTLLINAFSFDAPYGEFNKLSNIPGVAGVSIAPIFELPQTEYSTDSVYPSMYSAGDMVNLTNAWDLGYDGRGTLISIIDSGLYVEHEAFSTPPESPKYEKNDIQNILDNNVLQAEKLMAENDKSLTADDVYYNSKIAFKFDYNGVDTDVGHGRYSDSIDHGTHVTGIAAGLPTTEMNGIKDTYARGMAPQAQIAAMKVFPDHNSGAAWDVIIAAVEDSMYLGADVVNLSLGSPSGFPTQEEQYAKIYDILDEYGVSIMAAAGNDTSSAYDSTWGTNFPTTANADSSIVDSPSTYEDSLSIAAVYNTHKYYTDYIQIGGVAYGYTDSAKELGNRPDLLIGTALGGQTLDMIEIPGYGREEDYDGVDVAGKVAFVIRGNGTFSSKMQAAANHGAVAMVVYDSKENNALTNMQIDKPTIPAVFISHNNGLEILETLHNGDNKLYISDGTGAITPMSNGGVPASFSGWGPLCDLSIKPELSAPGGNIMSTVDPEITGKGELYGSMSGTSMATPAVSGAAAIVRQYVNEKFPDLSGQKKVELINTLLMSTAVPLKDSDGVEYSVRKQGAGMIDMKSALVTGALLTVDDCVRPKLELGDDPARTGVYTLQFNVYNFSDKTLNYKIEPVMQTGGYEWIDQGTRATYVSKLESTQLTDKMTYTTNHTDNIVTVEPGATEKITVTMTIDADVHEMLKDIFPYGAYIEGYCYLRSMADSEGAVYPDLSICYLGFYGSWSEVPVVDQSFYYDAPENQLGMMAYPNTLGSKYKVTFLEMGMNPYFTEEDEEAQNFSFIADRCSISPLNKDKYYDAVDIMYTGIMRNLSLFYYSIFDSESGEVYWERSIPGEMTKNLTTANNSEIYPMGYAINRMSGWNGANAEEGTTAMVRCGGEPCMNGFDPTVAKLAYWEMPVTVDNTAPYIADSWSEGNILYVKVKDNHYAAYAGVYLNETDTEAVNEFCISENERGAETIIEIDMTGKEKAYLLLGDYAKNEAQYEITLGEEQLNENTYYELAETVVPGDTYLIVSNNSLCINNGSDISDFALSSTPAMPNSVRLQGIHIDVANNRIEGSRYNGMEWVFAQDGSLLNVMTGTYLSITENDGSYWLGTAKEANAHWSYNANTLQHDSSLTDAKLLVYAETIKDYAPQFDITADKNAEGTIRLYHKIEASKASDVKLYAEAKAVDGTAFVDVSVKLNAQSHVTAGTVAMAFDAEKVVLTDVQNGNMAENIQFNRNIKGKVIAAFDRGNISESDTDETVFTARFELKCEPSAILVFDVFANELYNGEKKLNASTYCAVFGGTTDEKIAVNVLLNTEISNDDAEGNVTVSVKASDCMNHVLSGGYLLKYDTSVFEYRSGAKGSILSDYENTFTPTDGKVEVQFVSSVPASSASGDLASIQLHVKDGVASGTVTEIALQALDFTVDESAVINSVKAEGTTYTVKTGTDVSPVPSTEPVDPNAVKFTVKVKELDEGKLTLAIEVSEKSNASSGCLTLSFDSESLDYAGKCIGGEALNGAMIVPNLADTGKLKIAFAGTDVIADEGGEAFLIIFNVKDNVASGTRLEFAITVDELLADDTVTEIPAVGIGCEYYIGGEPVPSETPTSTPTMQPTDSPTASPSEAPTVSPTAIPTEQPTTAPTSEPSIAPTQSPTEIPTELPSASPTAMPTAAPTSVPEVPGTGEQIAPYVSIAFALIGLIGMSYYLISSKSEN